MAPSATGRLQLVTLLLFAGCSAVTCAGDILQWTDRQGQTHFGDRAPADAEAIQTRPTRHRKTAAAGLRPGEIAALRQIEQRTGQQRQRARTARRRSEQQQAAARAACRTHREQLHRAQGKNGFKKHASYLRTHCW